MAPGEKWHKIDVAYFKTLLYLAKKYPGFEPEVQGVYEQGNDFAGEVWQGKQN